MITKGIQFVAKDIDMSKREAVLAHATYKTLDKDGDRSNRGMFDKSWKEQFGLIRYFLNHDRKQAPGKILQTWDDQEHAYTRVKHGTHTLGEDVLKMLDEGVIMAVSFGFEPVRYSEIKGKGKDFREVTHFETSVLTHWGAHDDSHVVNVTKDAGFSLKQLSEAEASTLRGLISTGTDALRQAVELLGSLDVGSDLYVGIQYIISRQSEMLGNLKAELRYGIKEAEQYANRIKAMEQFIRNTKASDEAIAMVQKSLNQLLIKNSDTVISTNPSIHQCQKCKTFSAGIEDESGCTKCAECGHVLKGSPDTSRSKDEMRKKMLALKLRMAING